MSPQLSGHTVGCVSKVLVQKLSRRSRCAKAGHQQAWPEAQRQSDEDLRGGGGGGGGGGGMEGTHRLDEVLQAQLNCQSSLSHATIPEHHQFVQHHFPRHGEMRRGGQWQRLCCVVVEAAAAAAAASRAR